MGRAIVDHLLFRFLKWSFFPSPKVIGAPTENFGPFFNFYCKIVVGGPPSLLGCAVASLGHSVARVNIWRAAPRRGRNMVFWKFIWMGKKLTCPILLLVDQSSPDFFFAERGRDRYRYVIFRSLDIRSVPEIFAVEVWSCPKSPVILHAFGPRFFLWRTPDVRTWIITLNVLPITWQSFTAIGRGSSEISR